MAGRQSEIEKEYGECGPTFQLIPIKIVEEGINPCVRGVRGVRGGGWLAGNGRHESLGE